MVAPILGDNPADGAGYFAWGFPFPYAEPTGVSSLEFSYMPQVLALNLVIIGLFAFLAIRSIFALGTSFTLKSAASALGLILTLMGASLNVMYLGTLGHATFTIGSNYDVYWSYRPMAIMRIGEHKACYF